MIEGEIDGVVKLTDLEVFKEDDPDKEPRTAGVFVEVSAAEWSLDVMF